MNPNNEKSESNLISTYSDPLDISPYISSEKKTVVLFEMTTCPYCRMFLPRFSEFAGSRARDFDFLHVTLTDPQNPLWHQYTIRAVPTVIVFAKGQIVSRLDSVLFLGITKKHWAEFSESLK